MLRIAARALLISKFSYDRSRTVERSRTVYKYEFDKSMLMYANERS